MTAGAHPDPLMLDGWLEFNRWKWGVEPLRVEYALRGGAVAVRAVLYVDKRRRVVLPKLNPHLPLVFEPASTEKRHRLYHQWLQVARLMAQDMRKRGLQGAVHLPSLVGDARPWQWAGFRVGIAYSFFLDFPVDLERADHQLGRSIRKALKAGYRAKRTTNMGHIKKTLEETETRQDFRLGLKTGDLEQVRKLLGDEHLRAYICYAPDGAPAASHVALHAPGRRAIDWIGGTVKEHLPSGSTQLVMHHAYQDLHAARAIGADMVGANIPSIASAKMQWGGYLVSYPAIEPYNLRGFAMWSLRWLESRRARKRQ